MKIKQITNPDNNMWRSADPPQRAERVAARIGGGGLKVIDQKHGLSDKSGSVFKQSLEQINERLLENNDIECIANGLSSNDKLTIDMNEVPERLQAELLTDYDEFRQMIADAQSIHHNEPDVYFYHSDHLGSASWITDNIGIPIQHLQYLPFGEPYIDQRAAGTTYSERFTFTGKELDAETGYSYFGARYYDSDLSGLFLSVDPMSDKYPSKSPYAYCVWNPVKLVDPDGKEFGDYYDEKGNYLGWDGNNDNNVYIVGNSTDKNRIKINDKKGGTTSVDDLQSEPLLKTTYGVLREACDVLDRAERNSGQLKEECSVVDYKSGLGVRSTTGEAQSADLPKTPDWVVDAVSIHSHNKFNDATQMSGHHADNNGDADHFGDFIQNVIVGPLGVGGASGLCFYPGKSNKTKPVYKMYRSVADKIIGQQSIRSQGELKKVINGL